MILDRIKQYLDAKGISVSAFERSIGMSNASFGKSLKNRGAIGTDKLENILNTYPDLSVDWLFYGKGSMFNDDTPNTVEQVVSNIPGTGIPYYDVDFIGGFDEIFNCQAVVPACNIVVPGFGSATLWCNVTGHSMEPEINHGDIVALRECTLQDIQYGEIYAVVLDTIRTIKILRKGSSPDVLRYVPINTTNFDEQEYPINRILKIFQVIGAISKFF